MDIAAASESGVGRMLACVTLSPHAPAVVRGALWLAEALRCELDFLHVGEDTARRRAEIVDGLLGPTGAAGTRLLIRNGRPEAVICRAAKETGADLVFIGALEQEGVYREIFGSTARRVARNAPCAVFLMVGPPGPVAPWPRIAAAVELDDASRALMKPVLALARAAQGELHILREYQPFARHARAHGEAEDGANSAPDAAQLASERFALGGFLSEFALDGLHVDAEPLPGRRGAEIVRHAVEHQVNLLAIATPARPLNVLDRFFGHPAECVLQKLPCSVLLHRPRRM